MEFKEGMVAFSKAGHDAGSYYLVVRCRDGFCWIADGRRRKLGLPKRKNQLHLAKTGQQFSLAEVTSDRKLRQLLLPLNTAAKPNEDGR